MGVEAGKPSPHFFRAFLPVSSLDRLVVFQNILQEFDIASDVAGQYNHALAERTRKNERLFFPFGCLLPGELLPFAGICRNEVAGRRVPYSSYP